MEGPSAVFETVAREVGTSSTKKRIGLFRGSLSSILDISGLPTEHVSELVDIVFATLPLYDDRPSQASVNGVICKALKEPSFVKAFTGQLVQTSEKSLNAGGTSFFLKLLEWSCLLIRCSAAVISAKNAFSRLVAVQNALLSALWEGHSPRVKGRTQKLMFQSLKQVDSLFGCYLSELQASTITFDQAGGLIGILLAFCIKDVPMFQKHKEVFVDLYLKMVLTAKDKPPKLLSGAFGILIKQLRHDEFEKIIVPTAVKALKRNPELTMEAVAILLEMTSLDLSKYVREFLPSLLVQARHSNETRRSESIGAIGSLACHSSEPDALLAMFESIRAVLGGSEGKLAFPYQRVGMVTAIKMLSHAQGEKALGFLSTAIVHYLLQFYKDDGNEEVRQATLSSIGVWLSKYRDMMPRDVISFFLSGLKEKESIRKAHLKCMAMAFQNEDVPGQMPLLADALIQLVKSGLSKAAQRVEGIYSLLLLSKIAAMDVNTDELICRDKLWPAVLQKDCVLFSPSLVAKLQVEDSKVVLELLGVLLQQSSRLSGHGDNRDDLLYLLVYLLWHPDWEIRKMAFSTVANIHKTSQTFSEGIFKAYEAWMVSLDEQLSNQRQSVMETANDNSGTSLPSMEMISKALIAVSSPHVVSAPTTCPEILLASHHPWIARGRHKNVIWKSIIRYMKAQDPQFDIRAVVSSNARVVCKILLGEYGLLDDRLTKSEAALLAMATVMQIVPGDLFPYFLEAVHELGNQAAHDALTERDIEVYNTPEGTLSSDRGIYIASIVADKNLKHAKGRFRMYEDDETEKEIVKPVPPRSVANRKESITSNKKDPIKSTKKTVEGEKSKSAKEEAREQQLKEEATIRSNVHNIKRRLSQILRVIGAIAVANPVFVHGKLPVLVAYVFPLLKSPIVEGEAYDAMARLSECVRLESVHMGADIAAALKMVATSVATISCELESPSKGVIDRVVNSIAATCKKGPLPVTSFSLVFPIFEQVLLLPKKTRLHDDLLRIFSLHCLPDVSLPRLKMLSVLYHVLGCAGAYHTQIAPMLRELCRGVNTSGLVEALSGLYSKHVHVRAACLDAVKQVPVLAKRACPCVPVIASTLWIALFDPDQAVAEAAEELWDLYGHELGNDYAAGLLGALSHENLNVRQAAAGALASAMEEYPSSIQETLSALFSLYSRDLPAGSGEVDPNWVGRQGVAFALDAAADVLSSRDIPVVATFLISRALADLNGTVRSKMVEAGIAIIDKQGKADIGLLLPIFENYLNKKAIDEERYDFVREGVVVFMGALAKHLSLDDPKIKSILERLLEVLNTPSESVQYAVSNCLSPLMQSPQVDAAKLTSKLLNDLLRSEKYGERRGAAFGLAGVVKGLGISSLKKFNIMDNIKLGLDDKNSAKAREGALLGIECLSEKLGRLFEPYVIHLLPMLLVCFSDQVPAVREATEAAARTIMSQLSGQGVKLILPALLKGLEDKAWRTKQGSVQLLGAMAFCAPRQLSQCLPTIVPKLSEVLTDPHPKVQAAAQTSLQQVGSVIKNPEISALVPTLLIGIADPNEHTKASLDVLLQTTFVNTVDAPSLALVVPIVHRGLRERSTETKKKAAQIVGNMSSLVTDHKDMVPYLGLLLPEVKKVLVDPIPEVRTVAAKALGSLLIGLGEENFPDLVPWLLETLKSENSSVERSGAAQGLSEVLAALGTSYFECLLPDIILNCNNQRAAVRDGYLTLFKYLPAALGGTFQKYLQRVLPSILDGLADENESVRDAALSAGHILVEHYATTSLPLLLPAVEDGIFHDNWRIRQSSVELLGDLLFKVAGTSGKVVLEGGSDDEGASTEAHGRAIVDVLGKDRRNEVLAAVYMVRSDVSLSVRQAALHVWKTVVANTPKTLKEIMPVLMSTLIASLGSDSSERRQVAGRSLGELVRKLGDRVLPSIIPILSLGLKDDNSSTRQGVCVGLSEVMASAGKNQLITYMGDLIPTIRNALCDSMEEVREAAGQAFNTLFKSAGMQAIDEIVPALLNALEDEETSDTALDGLKQILSVRTAAVLPHILPKLVQSPLTAFNAHALGALAEVAGPGLNSHLSTILSPLITAMGERDSEVSPLAQRAAEAVVMAVDDEGISSLTAELVRGLGDSQASNRRGSAYLSGFLFKNTKLDLDDEVANFMPILIVMLTDPDAGTIQASWEALANVCSTISKEDLPSYIKIVRDAVSTAKDKERRKRKAGPVLVPGLCMPKGLQPLLPIYLQGLMSGSAELREQAAEGLGELINVTDETALKPFVVPITGPLIRVIGDRFPWQVKSAILGTLGIIISKGNIALKPFLPQLQTTFIKCLQDNARTVRSRSAWALGRLTSLSTRVDPLVNDLLSGIQTSDGGIKEAMLVALKGVVRHAGKSLSSPVLCRILVALQDMLGVDDDQVRSLAAKTLGITSEYLQDSEIAALVQFICSTINSQVWTLRQGTASTLASILRHTGHRICKSASLLSGLVNLLKARAKDDKYAVRERSARALGRLLGYELGDGNPAISYLSDMLPVLISLMSDDSSDVRRRSLSSLKGLSKVNFEGLVSYWPVLGPVVAEALKDNNTPVRLAAERTAFHLFQLYRSAENIQSAQKYITGLDARRIAKQQEQSDASEDSEGDSLS